MQVYYLDLKECSHIGLLKAADIRHELLQHAKSWLAIKIKPLSSTDQKKTKKKEEMKKMLQNVLSNGFQDPSQFLPYPMLFPNQNQLLFSGFNQDQQGVFGKDLEHFSAQEQFKQFQEEEKLDLRITKLEQKCQEMEQQIETLLVKHKNCQRCQMIKKENNNPSKIQ